nr:meprin=metalloendopeptidase [mice, Peptide Partial, 10 aa] [Mus sp.]
QTHQGDSDHN